MPRFVSINQVPVRLRKLRHSRLSLGQIEGILERAEAVEKSDKKTFAAALGEAQAEFIAAHVERDGVWMKKKGAANE